MQGDEQEPPIAPSPPSQKDRDEAARKQQEKKDLDRIAKEERARKSAMKRLEGARKRGLLKDPQAIETLLGSTKDSMVRDILQAFIQVEVEKMKGEGGKGASQGNARAKGGNNASGSGKGGNRATDGREMKEKAKEGRSEKSEKRKDSGAGEGEGKGMQRRRRRLVEVVTGDEAKEEEGAKMVKSIRCAQLQVRGAFTACG